MTGEEGRGHHRHIHDMRHTETHKHNPILNTASHTENLCTLLELNKAMLPTDQTQIQEGLKSFKPPTFAAKREKKYTFMGS